MKESLEEVLRRELVDGEELLWCGRPQASVRLLFAHIGVGVVVFLFFGALSVFSIATGISGATFFFVFLGALVLAVVVEQGMSLLRSGYGITTLRVVLLCGWRGCDIASVMLDRIDGVYLKRHNGGRGSIYLGSWLKLEPYHEGRRRNRWRSSDSGGPPVLRCICDAQTVYDLILSLMIAQQKK